MRFLKSFLSLFFVVLLLCGTACAEPAASAVAEQVTETEAPLAETSVVKETVTLNEVPTAVPSEEPTAAPAPEITAEPEGESAAQAEEPAETEGPAVTAEPVPTREPFSMEGDVTDHFPDYDTGVDADFSYQSDELRIAIKKYVNPHDPEIPEVYYVADIWMRNVNSFRTGFAYGRYNAGREDGEDFAEREHAILAVNGTMNTGLVLQNRVYYKGASTTKSVRFKGIMLLYEDGSMKSFNLNREYVDLQKEQEKGVVQAWHFGPLLIQDGKVTQKFNTNDTRHPRIILGYYEPGHYCVVAVDGRNSKRAIGMNEYEMSQLMLELGVKDALNLDGGTSAIMVFMGKCINKPSGTDKDGDGKAGREIADMLLFGEYDREGNAPALDEIDVSRIRFGEIE